MTFVPPVLHAPTLDAKRRALVVLWPHVKWGTCSMSLEHDVSLLTNELMTKGVYLIYLPRWKCLELRVFCAPDTTLVNSPAHMLAYLRHHGQLPKS